MTWWLDVVGHKRGVWNQACSNSKYRQVGKLRSRFGGKSVSSVWGTLSLRRLWTSQVKSLSEHCAGVEVLVVRICSQIMLPLVNAGIWNQVRNWEVRARDRFRTTLFTGELRARDWVALPEDSMQHWWVPTSQGKRAPRRRGQQEPPDRGKRNLESAGHGIQSRETVSGVAKVLNSTVFIRPCNHIGKCLYFNI